MGRQGKEQIESENIQTSEAVAEARYLKDLYEGLPSLKGLMISDFLYNPGLKDKNKDILLDSIRKKF